MDEIVLKAQSRNVIGKQVRALRRQGLLPAVIYGHNQKPLTISLNRHESSRVLPALTSSQLIMVDVEGDIYKVLVREKQRHPVSSSLLHVDFLAVSETETLRATVGLVFVGEAPAIKTYGAVIVTVQEVLEVESLPRNLPNSISVDLSGLSEIGDTIYVRDLVIPADVKIWTDGGELVAVVNAPISEEELAVSEGVTFEPEVIERGKKEEEDF